MTDTQELAREIERLHRFFEDWYNGVDDRMIDEFADSLDDDFFIVSPGGEMSDKERIVEMVRSHRDTESIEIRIGNVGSPRWDEPGVQIATYEEHQTRSSGNTVLTATVGLVADVARSGGFRWLFVHESWLVAPDAS